MNGMNIMPAEASEIPYSLVSYHQYQPGGVPTNVGGGRWEVGGVIAVFNPLTPNDL
jgi:hypothetical protein